MSLYLFLPTRLHLCSVLPYPSALRGSAGKIKKQGVGKFAYTFLKHAYITDYLLVNHFVSKKRLFHNLRIFLPFSAKMFRIRAIFTIWHSIICLLTSILSRECKYQPPMFIETTTYVYFANKQCFTIAYNHEVRASWL